MKNGNEPAFPCERTVGYSGITKREYFAAKADISLDDAEEYVRKNGNHSPSFEDILNARVKLKYLEADAMIKESEKEE